MKEFTEDIWSMTKMMDLLIIRQYDVGFNPDLELVLHYPIKKINEIGKFLNLMCIYGSVHSRKLLIKEFKDGYCLKRTTFFNG